MNSPARSVSREVQFAPMSQKPPCIELPEEFTEAAILFESLSVEWIDDVSQTAIVNRKSGYQLPTLLLFFFAYFSTKRTSLKELCNVLQRRSNRLLAEFAGFERFPTQPSVSRFLRRVRHEQLERLVTWILVTSHSRARALLRRRVSGCLDTYGDVWQLFDLDPSVTGLRQRYLPEDSSLPPAIRNTDNFAAPGYAGRKRADVIVRRTLLQHVGSSLWVGSWIREGGGGTRETFEAAIRAVVECSEFAGFDLDRVILRVDGEGGGVPYLTAYQQAGIRYLVRCAHYRILDEVNLNQLIAEGSWFEVDGTRLALDLGERLLRPGSETTTAQGTPYEPVFSRVILSRMPLCERESGAGKVIDGYRYELFATNLEPTDWPAAETAKAYSHRSAIENRLALEDRDLGLDKVFSFDLAGHALVTVIGLLVWNLRILCGFALATTELDAEGVPRQSARDARAVSLECDAPMDSDVEAVAENAVQADVASIEESLNARRVQLDRAIHQELDGAFASAKLPATIQWTDAGLTCVNDAQFGLANPRTYKGRDYAILMAPPRICGGCAHRLDCSRSTDPAFRKEVSVEVGDASRFVDLLKQHRTLKIAEQRGHAHGRVQTTDRTGVSISATGDVYQAPDGGPLGIALGMLNPRALVHRFADAVADMVLHVQVSPQPFTPHDRRYTYRDAHARQRRRHTWNERLAYNRRIVGPRITVFSGPRAADLTSLHAYDRTSATQARQRAELM